MGFFSGWDSRKEMIHYLTTDTLVGSPENPATQKTIAKCVRGNTLYAVHETSGANIETQRFLVVYIMNGRDRHWSYKPVDECMGPTDCGCPVSYFDLVGPPPNEYAAEWRERCRQKAARLSRKVEVGDYLLLRSGNPRVAKVNTVRPLVAMDGWRQWKISRKLIIGKLWDPKWATGDVTELGTAVLAKLDASPADSESDFIRFTLAPFADKLQEVGAEEEVCQFLRTHPDAIKAFERMAEVANFPRRPINRLWASFRPQVWVGKDELVNIFGVVRFDATERFLSLPLEKIRSFKTGDYDSDSLAEDLEERCAHDGPFEVDVDPDFWFESLGIEDRKAITQEQLDELRSLFGVQCGESAVH